MKRIESPRRSEQLPVNAIIGLATELAERYQISSTRALLESSTKITADDALNVAIVGRFKAGKSSFLNHFLNRQLLPVGVVPVTTVVTEISFGQIEKASVHFANGQGKHIELEEVRSFVAESENPGNCKNVLSVSIELPELAHMSSLRFIDLPGLESALAHNTEAVLNWLPNVGLALVAISVDPPLPQSDIDLLRTVLRYTPHVAILLTKIDLLSLNELDEVRTFIQERLARTFGSPVDIYPYSVRPGFESYKTRIEDQLIGETLARFEERHKAVLARKLETLLRESRDYLTLALTTAEMARTEREKLKLKFNDQKQALGEVKSELRLIVQHAASGVRGVLAQRLNVHHSEFSAHLAEELTTNFPEWVRSLAFVLECYEGWLSDSLSKRLLAVSQQERGRLLEPLETVQNQVRRALQSFRDGFSDKTEQVFGVQLRTTETEIQVNEPQTPDVRVGRVFDRNWELLSPVAPMWIVGPIVLRHFRNKLPYIVEKNLSRLASQWEESIRAAMTQILKEAERRLDELVETVERLIATSTETVPQIRGDLQSIDSLLERARQAGVTYE